MKSYPALNKTKCEPLKLIGLLFGFSCPIAADTIVLEGNSAPPSGCVLSHTVNRGPLTEGGVDVVEHYYECDTGECEDSDTFDPGGLWDLSYASPYYWGCACSGETSSTPEPVTDITIPGGMIFKESWFAPPKHPFDVIPSSSYSAPNKTIQPRLIQALSLGPDSFGDHLGYIRLSLDPTKNEPVKINEVSAVLKRATGIMDIEADDLSLNQDLKERRYETPDAVFLLRERDDGALEIAAYQRSDVQFDQNGNWSEPQNKTKIINLQVVRGNIHGEPAISISGDRLGEPVDMRFTGEVMHEVGAVSVKEEGDSRSVVTDSYMADAEDLFDGYAHVRSVAKQIKTAQGTWDTVTDEVNIWRTLINKREVLIEKRVTVGGQDSLVTRYEYYDELALPSGLPNMAFGQVKSILYPDGSWKMVSDTQSGTLRWKSEMSPWLGSATAPPAMPEAGAETPYVEARTMIETYPLSQFGSHYTDSVTVSDIYIAREYRAGPTSASPAFGLSEGENAPSEASCFWDHPVLGLIRMHEHQRLNATHYITEKVVIEGNGQIRVQFKSESGSGYPSESSQSTTGGPLDNMIGSAYKRERVNIAVGGVQLNAASDGEYLAEHEYTNVYVDPSFVTEAEMAIVDVRKTRRLSTVTNQAGQKILELTAICEDNGVAISDSSFLVTHSRKYEYDDTGRLEAVYENGIQVEGYSYTEGSVTIQQSDGTSILKVLDPSTGEVLSKSVLPRTAAIAGNTHTIPGYTEYETVVVNANASKTVTTHLDAGDYGTTRSVTFDAAGRIIAKVDDIGRTTEYQYSAGGLGVLESMPSGETRITTRYRDGRLLSVTGSHVMSEYHDYAPPTLDRDVVHTTYYGDGEMSEMIRVEGLYRPSSPGEIHVPILDSRHSFPAHEMRQTIFTKKLIPDAAWHNLFNTFEKRLTYSVDLKPLKDYGHMGSVSIYDHSPGRVEHYALMDQFAEEDTGNGSFEQQRWAKIVRDKVVVFFEGAWWERDAVESYNGDMILDGTIPEEEKLFKSEAVYRVPGGGDFSPTIHVGSDGSIARIDHEFNIETGVLISTSTRSFPGVEEVIVSKKVYLRGLLVEEHLPGMVEPIIYTYDALGRTTSIDHPEKGLISSAYHPDGRLQWSEDSAGNKTHFYYHPASGPGAGLLHRTVHADGTEEVRQYDAAGRLISLEGSAQYKVHYSYDQWGKVSEMKTWRSENGVPDVTKWLNDPVLGVVSKTDASDERVIQEAPAFVYETNPERRTPAKRTLNSRGIGSTRHFDLKQQLTKIVYDDATLPVSVHNDTLGRPIRVQDASGERQISYSGPGGVWDTISYDGESLLPGISVARTFDGYSRVASLTVYQDGEVLFATGQTHRPADGKMASVSHGGVTASYDWSTSVGGLPAAVQYSGAGLAGSRMPDAAGRLQAIDWQVGNTTIVSHSSSYDNRNRRTESERHDGTRWDYDYNSRGEVESAGLKQTNDGVLLPGRGFSYDYDGLGNRQSATLAGLPSATVLADPGETQVTGYGTNSLNQYQSITRDNPWRRLIQGVAHPQASVEVVFDGPNGQSVTAARVNPQGVGFVAEASLDTALGPVWRHVTVRAERSGVGAGGAQTLSTTRSGWMFFPPQNETLTYDEDGNLTSDARWLYTWDAENRLVAMEEKIIANASPAMPPPARKRLEFTYDHQHRRVRKVVKSLNEGLQAFEVASDRRYLYDDWNLIAEFAMNAQTSTLELVRSYAWGLDLSGTEQGAGGVGGLLLVHQPDLVLAPCYDPNGNITAYVDCATGQTTHAFEYDPFGAEIALDALLTASTNAGSPEPPAFRFSTKFTDTETALVYYGYRYYVPEMGRWLNRDPIEEKGGVNLYGMVGNAPMNVIDHLGLSPGWFTGMFGGVAGSAAFGLIDSHLIKRKCKSMSVGDVVYIKVISTHLFDIATGGNFGMGETYVKITKTAGWRYEESCGDECKTEIVIFPYEGGAI